MESRGLFIIDFVAEDIREAEREVHGRKGAGINL